MWMPLLEQNGLLHSQSPNTLQEQDSVSLPVFGEEAKAQS